MGDKKQFRSDEARKNYEKQEKLRERAKKRKAFQARKDDVTAKAKAWLQANPKQAIVTAAAVIAAILVVWLACKWFVGPGGSIPNFFGKLVGVQDNWLVINTSPDSKDPRYYHLADFEIPEGFQLEDFSVYDDELQQDFYCTAAEEGVVSDFYVAGVKNMKAEAYLNTLLAYQLHKEATTPAAAVVAGKDAHYSVLTFDESNTDGEGMGYKGLCIYMDTAENACISVMINTPTAAIAELPDDAALLAEAEVLLAGLTIVE